MHKAYKILIYILPILAFSGVKAQEFYTGTEYGISAGGSEYFGDLNENYGLHYVRPCGGGFIRYQLNPFISVKGVFNVAHIGYDDKYNTDAYDKLRNLNFQSNIVEFAAQAEFNFFRFSTGEEGSRFTPYLTGGIGVFYYDPYTYFNGTKYYLRLLGTEGQNAGYNDRKYSTFSVCFPVGAGVKYWIRPGFNIGCEIADRLTLTDYIDDVSTTYVGANKFPNFPNAPNPAYYLQDRSYEVSPDNPLGRPNKQRGNASTKDQYMFFMINLSFQLKTYRCPNYKKRETEYPRF
jgi:hypothetical protein